MKERHERALFYWENPRPWRGGLRSPTFPRFFRLPLPSVLEVLGEDNEHRNDSVEELFAATMDRRRTHTGVRRFAQTCYESFVTYEPLSAKTAGRRPARTTARVGCVASLAVATCMAMLFACVGDEPTPIAVGPSTTADGSASPAGDSGNGELPQPDSGDTSKDAHSDARADGSVRFCQTQAPLAGIANFFCADFDGVMVDEGFTSKEVPDGGALEQSTDIYFSEPSSLVTKNNSELVWKKSGALPFSEMSISVRVNVGTLGGPVPPTTGSVRLLRLAAPGDSAELELNFTRGRSVDGEAHTGYYIAFSACPSACAYFERRITNSPSTGVWTELELVWTKAGFVKVSYNDVEVFNTSLGLAVSSTEVEARLGLLATSDPPLMPRYNFDNLLISVKRD